MTLKRRKKQQQLTADLVVVEVAQGETAVLYQQNAKRLHGEYHRLLPQLFEDPQTFVDYHQNLLHSKAVLFFFFSKRGNIGIKH